MSDLPTDPAAAVIGRQLSVGQNLRVEEVVLQKKSRGSSVPGTPGTRSESGWTYHFSARKRVERRPEQLPAIYKSLHDEVCHWRRKKESVANTEHQTCWCSSGRMKEVLLDRRSGLTFTRNTSAKIVIEIERICGEKRAGEQRSDWWGGPEAEEDLHLRWRCICWSTVSRRW